LTDQPMSKPAEKLPQTLTATTKKDWKEVKSLGELINTVPPKPANTPANRKEIGLYYDKHRPSILKDIKEMGKRDALARWNIALSTWSYLQKKWARQDAGKYHKKRKLSKPLANMPVLPKPETDGENKAWESFKDYLEKYYPKVVPSLPTLPVFNESWQPEVQIKWMEVWLALANNVKG